MRAKARAGSFQKIMKSSVLGAFNSIGNHTATDVDFGMVLEILNFEIVNKVLQSKGGTWTEM